MPATPIPDAAKSATLFARRRRRRRLLLMPADMPRDVVR